ncbi:MAG TPA: ADOP family duplicated permease [Gemmatimonadales bacterium]|nr:ADOP family duplicated permease [Gemmatimonadales bacterium]
MIAGEWWRRLCNLWHRDRATADLEDEMRLHLALRAERLTAQGLSADDAASAAHRRFGNRAIQQEHSRDAWGWRPVDALIADVRYAIRRLAQRPAFTASVVIVLALGIGATTAMFSAVDAAMLRPLPFPRADRLLRLHDIHFPFDMTYMAHRRPAPTPNVAHPVSIGELRDMHDAFSSVGAYAAGTLDLGDPRSPQQLRIGLVTPDLLGTLDVTPIRGRLFTDREGAPAGPPVAMLSYQLWQDQYGGGDVLGQAIRLGGQAYTVVGVMPRDFSFPEESAAWIPLVLPMSPDVSVPLGGSMPSEVIARVAPGVSVAGATTRLLRQWRLDFTNGAPATKDIEATLAQVRAHDIEPLQRDLVGTHHASLLMLLGLTGMLLMLAAVNAASLMLSDAPRRRREVAIREVLGATRARVIRQLLIESLLLALGAGLVGVAIAPVSFSLLRTLLPTELTGLATMRLDDRVLGVSLLVTVIVGVAAGVAPAFRSTSPRLAEAVKSGGRSATGSDAARLRRLLLGVELTLTVVLLIGAGLFLHALERLTAMDRGVDAAHVGTLEIALPLKPTPREIFDTLSSLAAMGDIWGIKAQWPRIDAILSRLRDTPGITAVAAVSDIPFSAGTGARALIDLGIDGAPPPPPGTRQLVREHMVKGDYFRALGIPIIAGRGFPATEDTAAPVAVISQAVAEQYWPGQNPIGRTFHMGVASGPPQTIVGVAANVSERGLDDDTLPQVYVSMRQTPVVGIVVRGSLAPAALLSTMQRAVHDVDPAQAVHHLRTLDDVVRGTTASQRANAALIAIFAALALTLATLGTYAVIANAASHRRRELGIRVALGATGSNIMRLLVNEMAVVGPISVAIGLVAGWMLSRVVAAMLFDIHPHDLTTFVVVPLVDLLSATVATLIPARRATRVNPADVMRAE